MPRITKKTECIKKFTMAEIAELLRVPESSQMSTVCLAGDLGGGIATISFAWIAEEETVEP